MGRLVLIAQTIAVAGGILFFSGCANWRPQIAASSPVSDARKERHAAAVKSFEEQRDQAQLQAALDRYQQGDVAGCEARLRNLIARRPDFADARVQLAELAWSFDNEVEAEAEYRAALKLAPNRADVHHALGLVLQATGRPADAQIHLEKACQLDPQNELYRAPVATNAPAAPAAAAGTDGILAAR